MSERLTVLRYMVKGWCIRQAKIDDTLSGEWKAGDIMYEVSLQRHDPVPMAEVTRRPNSEEVDDYMEYKRLRKRHRENDREGPGFTPLMPGVGQVPPRLQVPANPASPPQSLLRMSPSISRTNTFKEPAFNASKVTPDANDLPSIDVVSPLSIPDQTDIFSAPRRATEHSYFAKKETISEAISPSRASFADALNEKHVRDSRASITRSITDELKEIIPWHELEDELPVLTSSNVRAP